MLSFRQLDIFPWEGIPQNMGGVTAVASSSPCPVCYLPHPISDQTLTSNFVLVNCYTKCPKCCWLAIELRVYLKFFCYLLFHCNDQNETVALVTYWSYQGISLKGQRLICFSRAFLSTNFCCRLLCTTTPLFLSPKGRHGPKQPLIR